MRKDLLKLIEEWETEVNALLSENYWSPSPKAKERSDILIEKISQLRAIIEKHDMHF
jgi:predicted ATP-dependent Lon-type protease